MAAVRQANHDASPEQGDATHPFLDARSYLLFTILQNRRSASAPQTFYFHSECEGMVELSGIEPLTPCLQSRCSTN